MLSTILIRGHIEGKALPVHVLRTCNRSSGIALLVLTLGHRWRWTVICTLRPLYPRERTTGTQRTGDCVGPTALSEEKYLAPTGI